MLPSAALSQHIAVLGKTGSGKTTTAKLLVEQVVSEGARVCILDPLKSDWWGLTSSADGTRPGLPFRILGGPRGHVPLHAAAGAAVAEVVASGALPLSIIDMADFEPGGQARFFVDFAPVLLRRMCGVLYLVIEEAHILAPKERSGIGLENMSIHWAKTLATAGRSKGIRLVILTQRTQALHNAVLGSCDTLIAHRFTAPADQTPVNKWLQANLEPAIAREVAASLSSLKTGEGWVCSGEAKIFERRHFPRITTFDNTKTPTGDMAALHVETGSVDVEQLRSLIGDALAEAEANDPKMLRKRIADLEREAAMENPITASDQQLTAEYERGYRNGRRDAALQLSAIFGRLAPAVDKVSDAMYELRTATGSWALTAEPLSTSPSENRTGEKGQPPSEQNIPENIRALVKHAGQFDEKAGSRAGNGALPRAERLILAALAQYPQGRSKVQVAILTGYAVSGGGFSNAVGSLRTKGYLEGDAARLTITGSGIATLGHYEPLPRGRALLQHWLGQLGKAERKALETLAEVYPRTLSKAQLANRAGYEPNGGGFNNALGKLRTLELVSGRAELKASDALFG